MDRTRYIQVLLPVKFSGDVTYALAEQECVEPGCWVSVEFGHRLYRGVVTATDVIPDIDPKRIKPVASVEKAPKVTADELRLWRLIADYYMCTCGEVFKSAYPPAKAARQAHREQVQDRHALRQQKAIEEMAAKIERETMRIETKLSSMKDVCEQDICRERQKLYASSRVLKRFVTGPSPVMSFKRHTPQEIAQICRKVVLGEYQQVQDAAQSITLPQLTPVQQKCKDDIMEHLAHKGKVLLRGVTGSGKTEIYAHVAMEYLRKGKSVLMMVPEIALSRQLEQRVRGYFPAALTYHSRETALRRDEVTTAVREGKPLLLLGTRSSILLPFSNLGCIIIDEEHDSSYKQSEPAPRYNARDCASFVSALTGVPVLMGSATPSYESLFNVLSGKYALVGLDQRYHPGGNVQTVIIDTLQERKKRGMKGALSIRLIRMMRDALENGGQVMLFRSRRSYSPTLQCTECGHMPKCPHCNVYLSYHKDTGIMQCHYCGSRYIYTGKCPECSGELRGIGSGTEKIEEEVRQLFPQYRCARLDSDTAQSTVYEKETINSFACGQTDILIGTQLITKGFDFERLSLVAVLGADSLIGVQDFRADESAIQLLTQLKGRCARRGGDGTFVIQTEQPEHPVYRRIAEDETNDEGLRERQRFGYPPFSRMVEIVMKSPDSVSLARDASLLHSRLCEAVNAQIGYPCAPAVDKVGGRHILTIKIRLKRDKFLSANKTTITDIVQGYFNCSRSKTEYYFNPDPM